MQLFYDSDGGRVLVRDDPLGAWRVPDLADNPAVYEDCLVTLLHLRGVPIQAMAAPAPAVTPGLRLADA